MKTTSATILAMIAGWALTLLGVMAAQLIGWGHLEDFAPMAIWTGLFAFAGWLLVVWPLMLRCGKWTMFRSLALGWLGWSLLGMTVYSLLTLPWIGSGALTIIWYPAIMGAISGVVYALLCRREKAREGG